MPATPGTRSLGVIDESRVVRDGDGLITHVDGKPLDDYLRNLTDERAQQFRDRDGFVKNDVGPVNSVVVDRQTGEVFEGVNGRDGTEIKDKDLHPLLQERLQQLRDDGPYRPTNSDGTPVMENGQPLELPYPHPDEPTRHAEVRAVNELLKAREAAGLPVDASTLDDVLIDNRFPFSKGGPTDAPCCVNCHNLLGAPSRVGRFTGWPPGDHNYVAE